MQLQCSADLETGHDTRPGHQPETEMSVLPATETNKSAETDLSICVRLGCSNVGFIYI